MKLNNIRKTLGNFNMDIPSMYLEHGKVHGLIGPNGSGKTSLAKLIMGIYTPDEGVIDYEGLTMREVTMTSQRPYLLHDTVYNNLAYPMKIRGKKLSEDAAKELLAKCNLQDKLHEYARHLSSGEQQKLSFLRAMVFEPKVVLVDETFSNLDPDSTRLFEDLILEQQKKSPITWVVISHQLVHINKICDQVHYMEKGRYVVGGAAEDMLKRPTDERVKKFLADTEVSFRD